MRFNFKLGINQIFKENHALGTKIIVFGVVEKKSFV